MSTATMTAIRFNRYPLVTAGSIEQPSMQEIRSTQSLWQASIDDALRFGGDLTRAAIGAMNLRGDRKHTLVDTKVHMLMPGFSPGIPGWHTDGAPRGETLDPLGKGAPNLFAQEFEYEPNFDWQETHRPHRFHTLVTGHASLTEFLDGPIDLELPSEPSIRLYDAMSRAVDGLRPAKRAIKSCQVMEFDWWDIHRAVRATDHEWRFFIRVTETDWWAPQSDLRAVLRNHQQVYIDAGTEHYGW